MKAYKDTGASFTEFDERMPVVQTGLVHHFPMDGKGGAFDIIGGVQSSQNIEAGSNLIDLMNIDWRNPTNWAGYDGNVTWDENMQAIKWVGYHNAWLGTPIIVDTTKHYRISFEAYFETAAGNNFYAGGYGETIGGAKYTANYDYSMACYYDEENNLGKWITFAATRYGTGSYGCANSFTFANVYGWTGENGVCYKYYLGALFNYNSGGVMYFRNPRIEIYESDTSNTLIRNTGISTVNAYTNLWTPLTGVRGWTGNYSATFTQITDYTSPSEPTDVVECVHPNAASAHPSQGHWTGTWNTGYFNTVQNNYYTVGAFLKNVNNAADIVNNAGWRQFLLSSWASANMTSIWAEIIPVDNEWSFAYLTQRSNAVESVHPYFSDSYQNGVTTRWSGMFVMDGARAIPFGTKSSTTKSSLTYGSFNNRDNYTIVGWFLPYTPFENEGTYIRTSNGATLFEVKNSSNQGCGFRYYVSGNTSMPYLDIDNDAATPYHAHTAYTVSMYVPVMWSFTKNGATATVRMYQNGTLLGTHISTLNDSNYCKLTTLRLGANGDAHWDGEHRSVSIYSSVLSDTVLNNMAKTFSSKRSTSEVVRGLSENDRVVSDGYYDSLTSDSTAITKHDTPTVKNAEGSYSMNALTNDAANFDNWTSMRTHQNIMTPYGQGKIFRSGCMTSSWSGNSYAYLGQAISNSAGQYFATSCWAYVSKNSNITWLSCGYNDFSGAYMDYDLSKKGTWQQLYAFPQNNNTSGNMYLYASIAGRTDGIFDGYYIWTQPMIVKISSTLATTPMGILSPNGTFSTPNIAASNLTFNLFSTLDLWWSNGWTITYWRYPILTHSNDLNGYNIDSLGCNGNSIGGGYLWYGKDNGSDTIASSSPGSFTPSDYFGKWQFVSLCHNPTNNQIIVKTILSNGTAHTRTVSIDLSNYTNYYVTQYGYDLNLGGWDDTAHSNTLFRDLRVFKRTLSDAEIQNLYSLKYRIYKNKSILVTGKITETN